MAQLTIDEFINRVNGSLASFAQISHQAPLINGQEIMGILLRRVFNDGLATDGQPIGTYKDGPYKHKREKLGRQTRYVDLQMTGDLFNSINVGISDNRLTLGFTNENRAQIARWLENNDHYGKPIFQMSQTEVDSAAKIMADFIRERATEIIRQQWK